MNKKKRYNNPLKIRLEILRLRRQAHKDIRKAENKEKELEVARTNPELSSGSKTLVIGELRKSAIRLRKHHAFLLERKIPMLERVLAKLQTAPMPFMGDSSELEEAIK